ncbi:uncharacterized protein LOC128246096 [Mya arenaria]|uniref:uncharacterized protein LOC128246096 n=1 Tax=Mya arenaria TaxID=6604 RepID=UPI0022E71690|nr:uncharacterized protein LOC128246096 [Mya arenaria]
MAKADADVDNDNVDADDTYNEDESDDNDDADTDDADADADDTYNDDETDDADADKPDTDAHTDDTYTDDANADDDTYTDDDTDEPDAGTKTDDTGDTDTDCDNDDTDNTDTDTDNDTDDIDEPAADADTDDVSDGNRLLACVIIVTQVFILPKYVNGKIRLIPLQRKTYIDDFLHSKIQPPEFQERDFTPDQINANEDNPYFILQSHKPTYEDGSYLRKRTIPLDVNSILLPEAASRMFETEEPSATVEYATLQPLRTRPKPIKSLSFVSPFVPSRFYAKRSQVLSEDHPTEVDPNDEEIVDDSYIAHVFGRRKRDDDSFKNKKMIT